MDTANVPDVSAVRAYLEALQDRICDRLARLDGGLDGGAGFVEEAWVRAQGGGGRSRLLRDGNLFEQAGVNFSHIHGTELPPTATAARAALDGRGFEALGVSLVLHPRNPYVPTTHANVRFFVAPARDAGEATIWWFGGGFDLTPYYPFHDDVVHWHRVAHEACAPFGADIYPRFKDACDRYFALRHRGETRGVGGLFFDDLDLGGFAPTFAFLRAVGDAFLAGYEPIATRRRDQPWGERERQFQLLRRGRYVEFNLLYDRGTLFGLQTGGRVESILMSLPPLVRWDPMWQAEPGSPEAELQDYLRPRDWLGGG